MGSFSYLFTPPPSAAGPGDGQPLPSLPHGQVILRLSEMGNLFYGPVKSISPPVQAHLQRSIAHNATIST
jgi:hypothetical protein